MSLRVWLPLNGNLNNQGLSDVTVTNNGATIDNNGKIGKCYKFGTSSSYLELSNIMKNFTTEASLSLWLYIDTWNVNYATFFQAGTGSHSWQNYIFGMLRNAANSQICFTISNGTTSSTSSYLTPNLDIQKWYHIAFIYKTGHCLIYINGELYKDYTTTIIPAFNNITKTTIGQSNTQTAYQTNCKLNDIRIYDHALSAKEIKELSKGLVCHYPLNDSSIQIMNNCYNYPTFDTSTSSGGWSHWGAASGSSGHFGQNTDQNYIYRKENQYSHWISDDATATMDYLLFQSPAFDGGYRSLCFILKEENSLPITENIVYPAWNAATSQSVPNHKWTSIDPLGNGFYLCKCEGINQDGSNNLVGIYVKPSYKVYVSEAYLENDRTVCSDILYPSNIVYDCSGYKNNMTVVGEISSIYFSPRYSKSIHSINGSYIIANKNCPEYLPKDAITVNIWIKPTTWANPISCTEGGGWNFENGTNGIRFPIYIQNTGYKLAESSIKYSDLQDGNWHMLTGTFSNITQEVKIYIDGVLQATTAANSNLIRYASNKLIIAGEASGQTPAESRYVGDISDVRIYATALSDNDILELYNTSVSIDNKNKLYAYEFSEALSDLGFDISKQGVINTSGKEMEVEEEDMINGFVETDSTLPTKIYENYVGANEFIEI